LCLKLPSAAAGSGIVQDDIVEVWGTIGTLFSYENRIGGTNTVPTVEVKYIAKQ